VFSIVDVTVSCNDLKIATNIDVVAASQFTKRTVCRCCRLILSSNVITASYAARAATALSTPKLPAVERTPEVKPTHVTYIAVNASVCNCKYKIPSVTITKQQPTGYATLKIYS